MATPINQICFTNEANCNKFKGHMLKPNMCTNCLKDVSKHNAETVSKEDLIKALETTQKGEKTPSMILSANTNEGLGKLYLGGFKAAINNDFLKDENVKGIVNTTGDGLFQLYGNKFQETYKSAASSNDIESLYVQWEDSISYDIPMDDLKRVIEFIHEVRQSNKAVLVHCAQGKSRSTTAVVAYLMVKEKLTSQQALQLVQEERKLAQPNIHFIHFLSEFEKSDLLKELRSRMN